MSIRALCPDPAALGRFHLKVADPVEWQDVVGHISVCASCRRALILLAESEDPSWAKEPKTLGWGASRLPRVRILKAAAAALLIGALAWAGNANWRRGPEARVEPPERPARNISLASSGTATPDRPVLRGGASSPVAPESGIATSAEAPPAAVHPSAPPPSPSGAPMPPDPAPIPEPPQPKASAPAIPPKPPGGATAGPAAPEEPAAEKEDPPPLPRSLAAVPKQEPPPSRPDFESPRNTVTDAFTEELQRHFSGQAWKDYVWDDYLTQPEVLLPVGLALSAAAVSHWDHSLERHLEGGLGRHGHVSDIGAISLVSSAFLVGILFPGTDRNGWDETFTIGEALGAASLAAYGFSKTGDRKSHSGETGGGEGHGRGSFHSSYAFAASELLERNSGLAYGLPAFGLAAFTAYARVAEGHRSPSDVLAGAAIGTLSAGIFDSLHWGNGTSGGIARRSTTVAIEADALKECKLTLTFTF